MKKEKWLIIIGNILLFFTCILQVIYVKITDEANIKKYGRDNMYFAPTMAYDEIMKKIPYGKVITVGEIRDYFAKKIMQTLQIQ